jgi:hypothetical protein
MAGRHSGAEELMPVKIEKLAWGGWPNCYSISNGDAELVVTGDVGPRIMRYGFAGGRNFFKVVESQLGKSGEPDWQLRGGHRIWLAPECRVRTYAPDNEPVEIEVRHGVLTATQPIEPSTGLRKQLVIGLADSGTGVKVLHRMQNTLPFAISFAPWALTIMAPGGTAVTGFPPRARHEDVLSPTNPLVMWAFTNLSDSRWTFLERYLVLRHDSTAATPAKLGHFNENTWGAYLLGSELFVKRYRADPAKTYPDMGCSYETFADAEMLEIETLGPLTAVGPGEWLEHVEHWSLHRDVTVPEWTDEALDRALPDKISSARLV